MHQQLPVLLGWSAGMSVWLWFLFSALIGAIHGNAWALIRVGAPTIFAVTMASSILTRTVGMAAVSVVVLVLTLAGVPASGGGMSIYMVPELFHWLHGVLPMAAGVDAVRTLTYLGKIGLGHDLLVILAWGGAALVTNLLIDRHLVRRPAHPPPARFGV